MYTEPDFYDPSYGAPQTPLEPYVAPPLATSIANPAFHDVAAQSFQPSFYESGFGAPQVPLQPYVHPYGPPVPGTLAEQVQSLPHPAGPPSYEGLFNQATNEGAIFPEAAATAGRTGLGSYLGEAGAGGLLSALRPGNIRAGFGEMGGPGALGSAGITLGGNILGQALVNRGGNVGVAGHGIKGAATGFGLGSLAAAGLIGADVLAPEVALPIEGVGALAGGLIGILGKKSSSKSQPTTGFSNDPKANDSLINQIMEQQMAKGTLPLETAMNLRDQYNLQMQIAGSDQQKLTAQQSMLNGIIQTVGQRQQDQQARTSQLQQQAQISGMLQPYLRSNLAGAHARQMSEQAIRSQLPPALRAMADYETGQGVQQARQSATSLAGALAVGPGLQQLISAINAQNAIQNRQNAIAASGSSSSSVIPNLSGNTSGGSSGAGGATPYGG